MDGCLLRTYVIATMFVGITLCLPVAANLWSGSSYYGLPVSRTAPDFELADTLGRTTSLSAFRGRYVFLMFGYLGCRDVCHTQVLLLKTLAQSIPADTAEFVYIDMNPEQDSEDRLNAYFSGYAQNFTALTAGSMNEVQSVAAAYGAYFSAATDRATGTVQIDHPGYVYLIDPSGQMRLMYSGNRLEADFIQHDYHRLLNATPYGLPERRI